MSTQPAEVELDRLKYAIKEMDSRLFGLANEIHRQAMAPEKAPAKEALEAEANAYRQIAVMLGLVTNGIGRLGEMNRSRADIAIRALVWDSYAAVTGLALPWPE